MRSSSLSLVLLSLPFLTAGCAGAAGSADGSTGGTGLTGSGGLGPATGGAFGAGGLLGSGGASHTGGAQATGGTSSGGVASGGSGSGGAASGGASSGGAASGGSSAVVDCNTPMPTAAGVVHPANGNNGSGNLDWEIWSNKTSGTMTTYDVPAFKASWTDSGDYLARLGMEWANAPLPHAEIGTISAQFTYTKTGDDNNGPGGYSYFGIYGWSIDPCIEFYIVDDSFNPMPVNPGSTVTKADNVRIDDGDYIMYTRQTPGTGGSRCSSSITQWTQYYSIRKTDRQCGTISVSEHFNAWEGLGMPLGDLLEAKILVEVGGGTGTAEFPVANVTLIPPP